MNRRELLLTGTATLGASLSGGMWKTAAAAAGPAKKVLFFTRSQGFQHSSIKRGPDGSLSHAEKILTEMGAKHGFEVTCTKDGTTLTAETIAATDVFAFYTTGDLTAPGGADGGQPMTAQTKTDLLAAIAAGKGFVGFHCATDTFHTPGVDRFENAGPDRVDPYIGMIGAEFIRHGRQQKARMVCTSPKFPGAAAHADGFEMMEEWYSLKDFAPNMHVILLQETKGMVDPDYERPPYPATWARTHGKGRVFYTSMGHREDVWTSPIFQDFVVGGLSWAAGKVEADVTPNLESTAPQCLTLPRKPPTKPKVEKKAAAKSAN